MPGQMIFLDFDGVLFDTVKEAYAVAMIADGKFDALSDMDFSSHHYYLFHKFRFLIGPAWNYLYLLKTLNPPLSRNLELRYREFIDRMDRDEALHFEQRFFSVRHRLQITNRDQWMRLNDPYPFLGSIAPLLQGSSEKFSILTTKDRTTVQRLLLASGLDLDLRIYDAKDFSCRGSKGMVLKKAMSEHNCTRALFIDDNRDHLDSCGALGNVYTVQPDWGYIGSDANALDQRSVELLIQQFLEGDDDVRD